MKFNIHWCELKCILLLLNVPQQSKKSILHSGHYKTNSHSNSNSSLWNILTIEKLIFLSFTVHCQEQTMHFPNEHLLFEFLFHWNVLQNLYTSLSFNSQKLTRSPWPIFAHKLIEAAFLGYAQLLRSLGLREGAALWASRAGTAGEQLMEELFQGEGKEQVEFVQESTEWSQLPWSWHVLKSSTCLFRQISLRLCKFSLYQLLWTWQYITEDYLRKKKKKLSVCMHAYTKPRHIICPHKWGNKMLMFCCLIN